MTWWPVAELVVVVLVAMPEQLWQASSVYWISSTGDLGSGATSMSIGDLG
jgi:hypothetical protein